MDAKILALTSPIPKTLFIEAGVFRGRTFSTYAELSTAIIRYLEDKVSVSMVPRSSSSSVTTSLVQHLHEGEQENEAASRKKNSLSGFSCSVRVKAMVKTKARAKEFAGTMVILITTAEIARTRSKTVGQRQCHEKARKTQ